jgi:UDP-2,3-diacylglucosamine pyrophosphatase LpxH
MFQWRPAETGVARARGPGEARAVKLIRLVVSDLHLGTGVPEGQLNPLEDFFYDDRFADLLDHYDRKCGDGTQIELILNGDIFDLLKVQIEGAWPTEITAEIAERKLKQCLDGHPRFVAALRSLLQKPNRRCVYLPGNHDLDMWFPAPQELFKRYVAPGEAAERVRFITSSDTYHLPEGIQIRHGHQLEHIHRVDYRRVTRKRKDGSEVLDLPWGSLWIIEVLNPAKLVRQHIDRVQPFTRFILGGLLFETRFTVAFLLRCTLHWLRYRIFTIRAWAERIRKLPSAFVQEIVGIGDFDAQATNALARLRGVHTLIVGHSHAPRVRSLPNGKLLVNTGTWMDMINLDLRYLGQTSGLTYALIEYNDAGKPQTSLMRWHGSRPPMERVPYAD